MNVLLIGHYADQERIRDSGLLLNELDDRGNDLNFFLSDEETDYNESFDAVIVLYDDDYGRRQCLRTRSLVWLSGEPPVIRTNPRTKWLNQFDLYASLEQDSRSRSYFERSIILPYHIDLVAPERRRFLVSCFQERKNFVSFRADRDDSISMICSSKKFTPAHFFRHAVAKALTQNPHAVVGGSFAGGFVADKWEFLKDHRYEIVVENSEHNGYFSEKLLDSLISGCTPIYFGSPLPCDLERGVIRLSRDFSWDSNPSEIIKFLKSKDPKESDSYAAFCAALLKYNPASRISATLKSLNASGNLGIRCVKPQRSYIRSLVSKQIWTTRRRFSRFS